MKKNKKIFGQKFERQLKRVNNVCLLPIGTSDFADLLQNAIKGANKNKITNDLIGKIKEGLCSETAKFLNSKFAKVKLDDEILNFALLTTLENGTIPAMYADIGGYIYLDNIIVGSIVAKEGQKALATNIGKKQLIKIMKGCFLETIYEFKPIKNKI